MPGCRLAAAFLNASINKRGARAELRNGMAESHASVPPERSIEFRFGIHLGDVVEETDGDLIGDGVNIAARRRSALDAPTHHSVHRRSLTQGRQSRSLWPIEAPSHPLHGRRA
jgi:class 3 adenylate cyclase